MRLWTIQSVARLAHLDRDRVIYGSPEHVSEPEWMVPYSWMVEQMRKRLPDFSGNHPIWAYTHKPDLRTHRHYGDPGEFQVRMEIEVPDGRCLVSDFELWHFVLNGQPIGTRTEWDEWEVLLKSKRFDTPKAFETWERVFDKDFHLSDSDWFGSESVQQVCIDGLKAVEVIHVDVYQTPMKA